MIEEVSMFERIINRIAERSETTRQLRANDIDFKMALADALGDAAPDDTADADGFVSGVESLGAQLVASRDHNVVAKRSLNDRITELISQRAVAYDAERAATKRADDMQAKQDLIAEKPGLLETEDDEPAGMTDAQLAELNVMLDAHPDTAGMESQVTPGEDQRDNAAAQAATNLGGQTASEIAAEIEGQAMVNDPDAAA